MNNLLRRTLIVIYMLCYNYAISSSILCSYSMNVRMGSEESLAYIILVGFVSSIFISKFFMTSKLFNTIMLYISGAIFASSLIIFALSLIFFSGDFFIVIVYIICATSSLASTCIILASIISRTKLLR